MFGLGHMSGVEILRHVLFLLGRHSGGVRLTRDSPGAEQGPRYVILAKAGLSVVKLSVASMTWFQIWPPSVGLLRSTLPAGTTRRSGRRILKLLQLSLFFAVPSPIPTTIARAKDRNESTMGGHCYSSEVPFTGLSGWLPSLPEFCRPLIHERTVHWGNWLPSSRSP
jgi:hypothetical protein